MAVLHRESGLRYENLAPENFDSACLCTAQCFTKAEPLTIAQKITIEEHLEFCRVFVKKAMNEGLSVVAVDDETNEVIGVRISEDLGTPVPEEADHLSEKFNPIFTLLDGLDERYKEEHNTQPGEVVHMFMIGVKKAYRNKSVAPNMNRCAFKIWKDLGYTKAVTEATGAISQHILLNKFHFTARYTVEYKDWEFEGKKVFAGLDPHISCILMDKDLAEL